MRIHIEGVEIVFTIFAIYAAWLGNSNEAWHLFEIGILLGINAKVPSQSTGDSAAEQKSTQSFNPTRFG